MCNLFAGQSPATYAYVTRSVRLGGHATSIRLEAQFWDILDEIAALQGMTTPRFLSTLHQEALDIHGEVPNFASLLRNACVTYLRRPRDLPVADNLAEAMPATDAV
jgi:predicted DNA-binding ribbon-helix-helix protein